MALERSNGKGPSGQESKKRIEHLPGRVILRVRRSPLLGYLGGPGRAPTPALARNLPENLSGPIDFLRNNAGLKSARPIFLPKATPTWKPATSSALSQRMAVLSSVSSSPPDVAGFSILSLNPKSVTPELLNTLSSSPMIEIVEPMPARWLMTTEVDPMRNLQWGLRAVRWFEATRPTAADIRVAVLDTGIDVNHPDLDDLEIEYHHEGLVAQDILGHGTHVAGVIAAEANNGVGIAGVADCRLDVWKIFDDQPIQGDFYVDGERYFQALNEARTSGASVMNLSIGGTASSRTEALIFRRLEDAGVLAVAAMGNEFAEGNPIEYPAGYRNVTAVGAVNENRERAWFSNTGRHIDLVAPGTNVLSTLPTQPSPHLDESNYSAWSGTSMATPHVAGAAALVRAQCTGMSVRDIKRRLTGTTTRLPAMGNSKKSFAYGTGLLNVERALAEQT